MLNLKLYPALPLNIHTVAAAMLMSVAALLLPSHANAAGAPPAPSVDVVVMKAEPVRTWVSFSGRLTPVESATIRPLVGGTIQQVLFSEGDWVKKGQSLFLIDPRAHEAAVTQAEAQVMVAQSRAKLATDELARSKKLVDDKLISQSIYDAAYSAKRVAMADIKQAQAALARAQLNVEYANVRAPIAGRVSRAELTVGNTVEAGPGAQVLTDIVATDKLYAEFNVDEATYINFVRTVSDPKSMPVELTLANDSQVVYQGHISAFDNRLNASSGTIRARAVFQNRDGALTAGMFANVRLGSASEKPVLLLPTRAVGTNQSKKFVLVVDAKNTANYREVSLGDYHKGQRIVAAGLAAGERVIVNGLSHVRPSTTVNPNDVTASADPVAIQ